MWTNITKIHEKIKKLKIPAEIISYQRGPKLPKFRKFQSEMWNPSDDAQGSLGWCRYDGVHRRQADAGGGIGWYGVLDVEVESWTWRRHSLPPTLEPGGTAHLFYSKAKTVNKVIPSFFYNPSSRKRHNGLGAGGHASPDGRSSSKVGERPTKESSGTEGERKISRSASARKGSYQKKEQDRLSKWSTTLSYPTSRGRNQALRLAFWQYSGPNHQPNQHILQDRMHPKEPHGARGSICCWSATLSLQRTNPGMRP